MVDVTLTRCFGLGVLAAISVLMFSEAKNTEAQRRAASYSYSPANYLHAPGVPSVLTVFPELGNARDVPLPFAVGFVAFGPDGKSLYAAAGFDPTQPNERRRGLLKIEFNPTRVTQVLGSLEFGILSLAISQHEDKIVISGRRVEGGSQTCGVFELSVPGGDVRRVVRSPDCNYRSTWTDLSLSPSGDQAVGLHNHGLELLDLAGGTSKSIGSDFWTGAWAPDGKWIAALEGKRSRLFLIDPSNISYRRCLGGTGGGVHWSPDSRYLLLFKDQLLCGFYFYSMETLEVATGKRSVVRSSRCKIEGGPSGWVDSGTVR